MPEILATWYVNAEKHLAHVDAFEINPNCLW